MRTWQGILLALALTAMAGTAVAEPATAIGVYYDTAATQTSYTFEGGPAAYLTAYIYTTNTEQTVGGAAFKLDLDPRITMLAADFPAGIQIGTLTSGIQIGMTECFIGYFGVPTRLATLTLWTNQYSMENAEMTISAYPRTGTIQLSDCEGNLRVVDGLTSYLTVPPRPTVGIFFDTAATITQGVFNGGYDQYQTAYIIVTNAEATVGGAAYKLELDSRITLLAHTYPAGIQIGEPLTGVQVGFTDCYIGYYGVPVLVSTLTLWTGNQLLTDAQLHIAAYPPAGTIQLSDCEGNLRNVEGGTAYLTIPVAAENQSWSKIKTLYGN
ncbi:MAG: hypothetical protein ACYDIE_07700 [Candidatus Krumholzibacteriia bacterium]